jgi:phenylacetate-CoA ligase
MVPWLVRHVVAPAWAVHERSPYLRVARRLARGHCLSLEERESRQLESLRRILTHANDTTDLYRQRFAAIGFDPRDLRGLPDLAGLPILSKQDIRNQRACLLSRAIPAALHRHKRTSGSTGVSLEVTVDLPCNEWQRGVTLFRDEWTGWRLGEWRALLWGNPPPLVTWRQRARNAWLERMFFLDTLSMDDTALATFARHVSNERPTLLFGHAHSLALFARFWQEHAYPRQAFKGIISTAMVLHPHERRAIETAFESRVFDRYGCEEVSLIASECAAHQGMHVNMDSLVVEILEDGHADRGGRIVVTDLRNRAMPLIRYEIGDRGIMASQACPCGRTYPLLERVLGRVADYLVSPRGELISGISLTENFATLIPGVEQAQLIQDRLHHLQVRVVPDTGFGEASRARIAGLIGERFGAGMEHDVEVVERIPQEPSGKYRFSICLLSEEERRRVAGSRLA